MTNYNNTFGFTLIELLVVVAIIGTLASVVIASLSDSRQNARNTSYVAQLRQYTTALELYYNQNGMYPDSNGWDCLGEGYAEQECWNGASYYSETALLNDALKTVMGNIPSIGAYHNNSSAPLRGSMYNAINSRKGYRIILLLEGLNHDCNAGSLKVLSGYPNNRNYSGYPMTECRWESS